MRVLVVAQVQEDQLEFAKQQLDKQTFQNFVRAIYVDSQPAKGINARRRRISDNHTLLRAEVKFRLDQEKFDYIFQFEGDSELPEDCIEQMIKTAEPLESNEFGYLTGVQVGRHGLYCIGAWHFTEDRKSFSSVDHTKKGVIEIDASGFYCLLADPKAWLQGVASYNEERWGPDVNFGLSLKECGYKIYADMDLQIGHKSTNGIIGLDNHNLCTVDFILEGDKWRYKVRG